MKQISEKRIYKFDKFDKKESLKNNYFEIEFDLCDMESDLWNFNKVNFDVDGRKFYTLEDWKFLSEIYAKIQEILFNLNKNL